jgi:hypothetical protein
MKKTFAAKDTGTRVSRNFTRHLCKGMKVNIIDGQRVPETVQLNNISMGGLSFTCSHEMPCGSAVTIRADRNGAVNRIKALVTWVQKNGKEFDIGLEFAEPRYTNRARVMGNILSSDEE